MTAHRRSPNGPLVCADIEKAWLGEWVTISADRDDSVHVDSLAGERKFEMLKGESVTFHANRNAWRIGDRGSMSDLVRSAVDWSGLPWSWV